MAVICDFVCVHDACRDFDGAAEVEVVVAQRVSELLDRSLG